MMTYVVVTRIGLASLMSILLVLVILTMVLSHSVVIALQIAWKV